MNNAHGRRAQRRTLRGSRQDKHLHSAAASLSASRRSNSCAACLAAFLRFLRGGTASVRSSARYRGRARQTIRTHFFAS